jgi:hypothetical protein
LRIPDRKEPDMDLRRTACALALPAYPLVLLAGTLVSPTDSTKNAVQLRAAAAHGPAWAAASLLELLAAVLMPLAVFGLVQAVRSRGTALASLGGLFGALGTAGMAAIAFRHMFVYGLAGTDPAPALHALDRVDHTFGPAVFPLMVAGPIAFIVLAGAIARAGIAPRWVVAGAVAFFVADMLPIPGAEMLQMLIGLTTFGVITHRLLTQTRSAAPSSVATHVQPAGA